MHSKHTVSAPAVLFFTREEKIVALGEPLWAIGVDCARAATWLDARAALDRCNISMVLVDGDLPASELDRIVSGLPDASVQTVLWLVSADPERQEHLRLPQSGIRWERVSRPLWPEELLHRVKAIVGQSSGPLRRGAVDSASSSIKPSKGQVIAVFSNKGGVGKSTIAVNVAVGLQRLYGDRVLLVDADLFYGDLEPLLDARGEHTIADLCMRQSRDPDSLLALTTEHPSGISFLSRPAEMARIETLDMSYLVAALPTYALQFDHVVVNMSTVLDEFNLSILDAADRILVVTTPEMPAALNTARFMEVAAKLKLAHKASIVLNRADSGTHAETIQEHLSLQFAAKLPSAGRMVVQAANEGTSLFMADPHLRQDITRALAGLVEHIAGRPRPVPTGWRFLNRAMGRAA